MVATGAAEEAVEVVGGRCRRDGKLCNLPKQLLPLLPRLGAVAAGHTAYAPPVM